MGIEMGTAGNAARNGNPDGNTAGPGAGRGSGTALRGTGMWGGARLLFFIFLGKLLLSRSVSSQGNTGDRRLLQRIKAELMAR